MNCSLYRWSRLIHNGTQNTTSKIQIDILLFSEMGLTNGNLCFWEFFAFWKTQASYWSISFRLKVKNLSLSRPINLYHFIHRSVVGIVVCFHHTHFKILHHSVLSFDHFFKNAITFPQFNYNMGENIVIILLIYNCVVIFEKEKKKGLLTRQNAANF